jgi:hypothetical protein
LENFFQINSLSHLHNSSTIFFCKTDFLDIEFKKIEKINNFVVLISGNSDYPIDNKLVKKAPKNIFKWYAQNVVENKNYLIPIPIGLENKFDSIRSGHGISYFERTTEKEFIITNLNNLRYSNPNVSNGKIYSNFNIHTNLNHRCIIKHACEEIDYIDWDEPTLGMKELYLKSINYEAVICPAGNGIDTHRLWEILYLGLIPITFKLGNYKIYEFYSKFPIVILENESFLYNKEYLFQQIQDAKKKVNYLENLEIQFWINDILLNSKIAEKMVFNKSSFLNKLKLKISDILK